MTYLLQVVVGFLMICMAFGPQSLWASFGPCTYDREFDPTIDIIDTMACDNGVCTGSYQIHRLQSSCMNTDESPCVQNTDTPTYFIYEPAVTARYASFEFLTDLGVDEACSLCITAACAVAGSGGLPAILAGTVACTAVCKFIDPCWYTTCTQDTSIFRILCGGHSCL